MSLVFLQSFCFFKGLAIVFCSFLKNSQFLIWLVKHSLINFKAKKPQKYIFERNSSSKTVGFDFIVHQILFLNNHSEKHENEVERFNFLWITLSSQKLNLSTPQKVTHDSLNFYCLQLINYKILYYTQKMGNCSDFGEFTQSPALGRLGPVSDLRITNKIWTKDYQGLFDYQAIDVRQQHLKIANSCMLLEKDQHKVIQELTKSSISEEVLKNSLFQIQKTSNYYKITPVSIEKEHCTLQKLLWLIIKSLPKHKYPLRQKDILKLGKQRIRIRQIVPADFNPSTALDNSSIIKTSKKIYQNINYNTLNENRKEEIVNEVVSIATQNQETCRICLQPGQLNNPLICPCKCTGSVKFIHLQCLRRWLGKQLDFSETKCCITIKWSHLQCQMCKTHFKYRIFLDNKKYYTVQIPKPTKPYIVIQIVKKSAEYSKILHFVSFSQNSKLSIGRKKDIDIKLSEDISISRHHANLIYDYENRQFMIQDNKSKFGTLVLVKRNLIITPKVKAIGFQIGSQIFSFETHRLQGSIPNYHEEQGYLNVVLKDQAQKAEEEQQSDQNNDEEDEFYQQIEDNANISQNPAQSLLPNHSHGEENHSRELQLPNQHLNQLEFPQLRNQSPNRQRQSPMQNRLLQPLIQNLDI